MHQERTGQHHGNNHRTRKCSASAPNLFQSMGKHHSTAKTRKKFNLPAELEPHQSIINYRENSRKNNPQQTAEQTHHSQHHPTPTIVLMQVITGQSSLTHPQRTKSTKINGINYLVYSISQKY